MSVPAVPKYLADAAGHFEGCPPGHRFNLYFPIWEANSWALDANGKTDALGQVLTLGSGKRALEALLTRQKALAESFPENQRFTLEARATAPFATGLGLEHPLENGFSFLNPYGLPYLPGSGVKGVLRQAARELASGDWGEEARGWSDAAMTALFGKESQEGDTDHSRGALTFWDVIPRIEGDSLAIEIMTPHQSHYYQDGVSPHESGQPTPIPFLTVPQGSSFVFYVQCHLARLAPEWLEQDRWRVLLGTAFQHAFQWLGFGAKTAVGYGAMRVEGSAQGASVAANATGLKAAPETVWPEATLKWNPGTQQVEASQAGKRTVPLREPAALLEALGERAVKLKKHKELKNMAVRVVQEGNGWRLIGLVSGDEQ
ncbi:CRISPR-associated protein Cmr6 [Gammaproteobacteria bacterium]